MTSVWSVLPESMTMISSAMPLSDARARGRLCSSLRVIRQAERRFIGCVGGGTLSSVSYTHDRPSSGGNFEKRRAGKPASFFLEADANAALPNAKLRAVQEHGRSHSLLVIKRAIGGVQILQVDECVAHFQQTVVSGNLRVIQGDVRPLPPNDESRFCQSKNLAVRRPRGYRENEYAVGGQLQPIVRRRQLQICTGSVGAGKRRQRADHHGLVSAPFDLHNRRLPALRALELHLWMDRVIGILQLVLCSAMDTRSLHHSNLTLGARRSCGLCPAMLQG